MRHRAGSNDDEVERLKQRIRQLEQRLQPPAPRPASPVRMVRCFEIARGFEDCRDLGGTQDYRQFFFVPRVRDVFDHPVPMENVVIEKAQCAHRLIEQRPRDLLLLNQEQLVLPDVFRSQPIREESEVLRELRDAADVNRDGVRRIVA